MSRLAKSGWLRHPAGRNLLPGTTARGSLCCPKGAPARRSASNLEADLRFCCGADRPEAPFNGLTTRSKRTRTDIHPRSECVGYPRCLLCPSSEFLRQRAVGNFTKLELCNASGAGRVVLQAAKRLGRERGNGGTPVVACGTVHQRKSSRRRGAL
jgi:hypothetical protein